MSDVVTTPEAPAVSIDPSSANNAPPASPPAAKPGSTSEKPEWLDARLEQNTRAARAAVLKELGVTDPEIAKKVLANAKASEEATKSADQRAGEYKVQFENERAARLALADTVGSMAQDQLSTLSEAQRQAVQAVAGDDASLQLKTISALRPTWASVAAPAASQTQVANTAPVATAPKEEAKAVSSTPDLRAQWEQMKAVNPVAAARWALSVGLFNQPPK